MQIRLSENIRSLRKEHKLTQEQLADALGVTVGAVYKWETGLSMPEIRLLMELADLFEVSVDSLLGYTMKSGNVQNRIERMVSFLAVKDYERAIAESEKALRKYPDKLLTVCRASSLTHMSPLPRRQDKLPGDQDIRPT